MKDRLTWRELRKMNYSRLENDSQQDCKQSKKMPEVSQDREADGRAHNSEIEQLNSGAGTYSQPIRETRFSRLRLIYLMAKEAFCHVRY